jgi:hypothetical protein
MIPLLALFVIFIIAFILMLNNVDNGIDLYKGGYTPPKEIEPIKNKMFFLDKYQSEKVLTLINKNNKVLQYVSDIKEKLPRIEERKGLIRRSVHIGQLKLFLSELEFLTEILPKHTTNSIVIYAGSAPSNKIYYLTTLFPNTKFIMVDPAEHFILLPDGNHYESKHSDKIVYLHVANKGNRYHIKKRMVNYYDESVKRIEKEKINSNILKYTGASRKTLLDFIKNSPHNCYIIEDFFTNNIADMFKDLDCYFISDIRSNINDMSEILTKLNGKVKKPAIISSEEFPSDLDICWNNAMHLNWLQRLQPKAAMLKFRVPYFNQELDEFLYYANLEPYKTDFAEAKNRGIDFVDNHKNKKHIFLQDDKIYIQSFPGIISTETRLICQRYDQFKEFDIDDYDNQFYYYNWLYRQFAFIDHGYLDKKLGIDGCNDCALMIKIFRDYFHKYNLPDNPKKEIANLLHIIHRTLKSDLHGYFMEPYKNLSEITEKQSSYILLDLYNTYKNELLNFL